MNVRLAENDRSTALHDDTLGDGILLHERG